MPCGYLCRVRQDCPQGHKVRERPWEFDSAFMPQGSHVSYFFCANIQNIRLSASNIYVLNSYDQIFIKASGAIDRSRPEVGQLVRYSHYASKNSASVTRVLSVAFKHSLN